MMAFFENLEYPSLQYVSLDYPSLNDASILYEENVQQHRDERYQIQKKTFTKWVNHYLKMHRMQIEDLIDDMRDGECLITLMEILSGETINKEVGQSTFHKLQNLETVLKFLNVKNVKLVNIRPNEIAKGNKKIILGLIWSIILRYQLYSSGKHDVPIKEFLLDWANKSVAKHMSSQIGDLTYSWKDGLVLSAIISGNRPDLLDFRQVQTQTPKERLEKVFDIAEREYGVTKLLDPEDVDLKPEEKSMLMYISSLQKVFPVPPPVTPLYDAEVEDRILDYKKAASKLLLWIKEKSIQFGKTSIPVEVNELKEELLALEEFKTREVPGKIPEKNVCRQIFQDLVKQNVDLNVNPDILPDNIDSEWEEMLKLRNDRYNHVKEKIMGVDEFDVAATNINSKINEIDKELTKIGLNVDSIHDPKLFKKLFEVDLSSLQAKLQSLMDDVNNLRGKCSAHEDLENKTDKLTKKFNDIKNLVEKRLHEQVKAQEKLKEQLKASVVNEVAGWCDRKLADFTPIHYTDDVDQIKRQIEEHELEDLEIRQFDVKVKAAAEQLGIDDELVKNVENIYDQLRGASSNKSKDLREYLKFLETANSELNWLGEKERVELARDWSNTELEIGPVQKYYEGMCGSNNENRISDVNAHNTTIDDILTVGENLMRDNQAAGKIVAPIISDLKNKKNQLLQLMLCLKTHLTNTINYQQFYKDLNAAEDFFIEQDKLVKARWSNGLVTPETIGNFLQKELSLRDKVDAIEMLDKRALTIFPLKLRGKRIENPISVTAICDHKDNSVTIEKDQQYELTDNTDTTQWKIRVKSGEQLIPSVYFVIPPVDQETLDAVKSTTSKYGGDMVSMLKTMLNSTIGTIKSWTFPTYKEQKDSFRRTLTTVSDKLMQEIHPNDPDLPQIQRDIDDVNGLLFEHQCTNLDGLLKEAGQILNKNVMKQFSDKLEGLSAKETLISEFGDHLEQLKPEVEQIQEMYRSLNLPKDEQKQTLDKILSNWKTLWDTHNGNIKLFDGIKGLLQTMKDTTPKLDKIDKQLDNIDQYIENTEHFDGLRSKFNELKNDVDKMNAEVVKMKNGADKVRRRRGPHFDITKISQDAGKIKKKYERVASKLEAVGIEVTKQKIRNVVNHCMVRILKANVMVRVGGGWDPMEKFIHRWHPEEAEEHIKELIPQVVQLRKENKTGKAFKLDFGTATEPRFNST